MVKEISYPSSDSNSTSAIDRMSDIVTRTAYSIKDAKDHYGRRVLLKGLRNSFMLPTEIVPYQDAVAEAIKMKQDGYSFIVPYPHYSKTEPLNVCSTLLGLSDEFLDAEYLSPLAIHQRKFDVTALSAITGIETMDIVTEDSVEGGKNFVRPTFGEKLSDTIFHRDRQPILLPKGAGLLDYIDQAGNLLTRGGIVLIAPQGGRRYELGQPEGRAVEMVLKKAQKKGAEKIAIWPISMNHKETSVYDDSTAGLNLGKTTTIKFGIPTTLEEIQFLREKHNADYAENLNLDQFIFTELANFLPPEYTKVSRSDTV